MIGDRSSHGPVPDIPEAINGGVRVGISTGAGGDHRCGLWAGRRPLQARRLLGVISGKRVQLDSLTTGHGHVC